MSNERDKAVAVEEAGHAIMALLLDGTVSFITIDKDRVPPEHAGMDGMCKCKVPKTGDDNDLDDNDLDDNDMLVGAAGRAAREIDAGDWLFENVPADERIIIDALVERYVAEGKDAAQAGFAASQYLENELVPRAKALLSEPGPRAALDRLVGILLERKTLEEDVTALVRGLLDAPPARTA